MQIYNILFVGLLCCLGSVRYAQGIHQPDLPSFGDFMEYYLSVPLSCFNVTDGQNVTNLITKKFAECTKGINVFHGEIFGNFKSICENQEKYLQCWDQLKEEMVTNCQPDGRLPAVYVATVKSLCGNDKGNTTISNFGKAMLTMTEEDRDNCPEETGIHWWDNCKSSLETMISENVCDRHDAIDKCVGKITCQNFEFGRLQKQLYSGGRPYLNCSS